MSCELVESKFDASLQCYAKYSDDFLFTIMWKNGEIECFQGWKCSWQWCSHSQKGKKLKKLTAQAGCLLTRRQRKIPYPSHQRASNVLFWSVADEMWPGIDLFVWPDLLRWWLLFLSKHLVTSGRTVLQTFRARYSHVFSSMMGCAMPMWYAKWKRRPLNVMLVQELQGAF